ncbi:magnesium transporter [Companilactobacillus crustorum]|uniref:Magnesium transporter CorA family protein n=3 Tax=Companilactobacillus TaxID=2767879 RepID=A0A837RJ69_9LACO|nr:magnesium transporter CorA family protein [Companilactobacillus crustorum]KRK43793.1 magnesium transporter CorA family protein [Companilactobacillus crustorum JCM 15951]KRO21150.1 magnesium transporter CorA family protein [Companilactobacillus crustorum]GEO76735.1 magnesium transporter [Companilactobacillus crustorum]
MINEIILNHDIRLIDVHSTRDLNDTDRKDLIEKYELTNEILDYADDENERARFEYDDINNTHLIVYNIQNENDQVNDLSQRGLPISFAIKDKQLFLFTNDATNYVKDYILSAKNHLSNEAKNEAWEYIFYAFDRISSDYSNKVSEIDSKRNKIQKLIRKHHSSESLILDLADLEDLTTYLNTAINGDFTVVKQLELVASGNQSLHITKITREHLHDSLIEIEQIKNQADLSSDIIDRISNTYNNILNNRTNTTMKVLTIYTIVLSIPTIVSGFYGMNMKLPVADQQWSWVFSLIITAVIILGILWDLHRRHSL